MRLNTIVRTAYGPPDRNYLLVPPEEVTPEDLRDYQMRTP